MRGRRTEQVKDLISDLENLFERAGVVDDEDKRGCFVRFGPNLHSLLVFGA